MLAYFFLLGSHVFRRGEGLVVTGPNMGGKSSTVRMVALICILGQVRRCVLCSFVRYTC